MCWNMKKGKTMHDHHHEHDHSCSCGHDHHEHEHSCSCSHDHHEHEHSCSCGHDHHEHDHGCSCGHDHHEHDHGCSCGHDHHEHDHGCSCGHDHHHGHGCACGHDHGHEGSSLRRIGLAALGLVSALLLDRLTDLPMLLTLCLYLPAYFIAGYDVLIGAARGIRQGHAFREDFLMSIATVGALIIGFLPGGQPHFGEAVFVMLFYRVGEWFEEKAEEKSRRSISRLMDLHPDSARLEKDGQVMVVSPESVHVGDIILIQPGDKVPLDGTILSGTSTLDTVALTGESLPREAAPGDTVLSGCVNLTGLLRVRVDKPFGESTASRILNLMESAAEKKSKSENFISVFAKTYTPAVVFGALGLAFLPPLFSGNFVGTFSLWLLRALTFLVVSCPCALVISVPLTFFAGIGGASRKGILIKGSTYIDALSRAHIMVFDKTGTLTQGRFTVAEVNPVSVPREELLHLAALSEKHSAHPIALALRAADRVEDNAAVDAVEEMSGLGIKAMVNGEAIHTGSRRLMETLGLAVHETDQPGTYVHVAKGNTYLGSILIADTIKATAPAAMDSLKNLGILRRIMLTGDRKAVAEKVSRELHLTDYRAELLPQDKLTALEELLPTVPEGRSLIYVGDGINDAPALARAHVGIAMGALGSDAAIEAADVVLMDDDPKRLPIALATARKTTGIARQNIAFAIGVKFLVLILSALGYAPMALAVFADVGVMVIAVINAMRALQ